MQFQGIPWEDLTLPRVEAVYVHPQAIKLYIYLLSAETMHN